MLIDATCMISCAICTVRVTLLVNKKDGICEVHLPIHFLMTSSGLVTGWGKKMKLCAFLEANYAGQKVNCVGNCAGLHNLASNKIFCIPLPVK